MPVRSLINILIVLIILVILIMALPSAGLADVARADSIERRGTEPLLEGEIVSLDDSGVTLRSDLGAVHEVPWDRVRAVEGREDDPRLPQLLRTAVDLWRARSRLERHDAALAEPLFERLWASYQQRTHETALVVAEGLLRCRLARGEVIGSVIPALEVARLRRAGVTTSSYSMLAPTLDPDFLLCTRVPPAWGPARGLDKLDSDLESYDARGDEVIEAFRRCYLSSLRRARGKSAEAAAPDDVDDGGVAFLVAVIQCGDEDASRRQSARRALTNSMSQLPEWARAWARYAVGISLLSESGVGRQEEGLLQLAYLPATFGRTQPHLAALALHRMIQALLALHEEAGAASLRQDLADRFARFLPDELDSSASYDSTRTQALNKDRP